MGGGRRSLPPLTVRPSPIRIFANGFSLSVSCKQLAYTEGTATNRVFWVISTASLTGAVVGDRAYVERQVEAFIQ